METRKIWAAELPEQLIAALTLFSFFNVEKILAKIRQMSALTDKQILVALKTFKDELKQITDILTSNTKKEAQRKLASKALGFTASDYVLVEKTDFTIFFQDKTANAYSVKIMAANDGILEKIYNSLSESYAKIENRLLAMDVSHLSQELQHVTRIEEKANVVLNVLEDKLNKIFQYTQFKHYQTPRTVCGSGQFDPDSPGYKEFLNSVLRIYSMPENAIYFLGKYPARENILHQIYGVVLEPLIRTRNFELPVIEKSNLREGVYKNLKKARIDFNSQFKAIMADLRILAMEKLFLETRPVNYELRLVKQGNVTLEYSEKNNIPPQDSSLFEDCTIVARDFRKCDLPSLSSPKLTLINDDELLLIYAEMSFKILQLMQRVVHVQRCFANLPGHLNKIPQRLTTASLAEATHALGLKFVNLDEKSSQFIESQSTELVSFATHPVLVAIHSEIKEITEGEFAQLLRTVNQLAQDANDELSTLYQEVMQLECKFENVEIKYHNFQVEYARKSGLAAHLLREHEEFPHNLAEKNKLLSALKDRFTFLKKDRKWVESSNEPLAEITTKLNLIDERMAAIKITYASCPIPINCIALPQQNDVMRSLRADKIKLENELDRIGSLILGQELLIGNADISRQKKFNQNSEDHSPLSSSASSAAVNAAEVSQVASSVRLLGL